MISNGNGLRMSGIETCAWFGNASFHYEYYFRYDYYLITKYNLIQIFKNCRLMKSKQTVMSNQKRKKTIQ